MAWQASTAELAPERALDWANEMPSPTRRIEHSMSIRMEARKLAWDRIDTGHCAATGLTRP